MGLFEREVRGFDKIFDLNRDGKLDMFEIGMELAFLEKVMNGDEDEDGLDVSEDDWAEEG